MGLNSIVILWLQKRERQNGATASSVCYVIVLASPKSAVFLGAK